MCNRFCPECYGQTIRDTCPHCGGIIQVCSVCSRVLTEKETRRDLPDKLILPKGDYHLEK